MSAAAMIASRRGNMRPTIGSSQKSSRYTEEAEAIRHLQKQTLTYKLRQGAFDGSDESDSGGWSSSDSSSGKHTLERRIAAKISMRKARKVDAFEFETNMSGVINQKFISNFDRGVRLRNIAQAFLGLVGIGLYMVEMWMAFDFDLCWKDWADPEEVDIRNKNCLTHTSTTNLIKTVLSGTTGLQALLMIEYYWNQLKQEKASWFVYDSMTWRRGWKFFLFIELGLILTHPFPTGTTWVYDEKLLGSIMFLRVYLFARVLRDSSAIYRDRFALLNERRFKQTGAVEFNWLLSVKLLFVERMWTFTLVMTFFTWLAMSYIIWIFERESNQAYTIDVSVWMTAITMMTVGYGDISPANRSAKAATGIAAVLGLVVAALLVYSITDLLTLGLQDSRVRNILLKGTTEAKHPAVAAEYIALWWHRYRNKSDYQGNDRHSIKLRSRFNTKNAYLKSILRSLRRRIRLSMELDDRVIDALENKMDVMCESISYRLALALGVKPKKGAAFALTSLDDLEERIDVLAEGLDILRHKSNRILRITLPNSSFLNKVF